MLFKLSIAAFITALATFFLADQPSSSATVERKKATISCGVDWENIDEILKDIDIPPMPGAGIYKWKISTTNDSAQFYFNQGINMYYGFHIIESLASFKKALKFDSKAPMIHWALALAYGPNINDVGYSTSPEAFEALNNLNKYAAKATPVERSLIDAMNLRYSNDTTQTREHLNQLYVDKLKEAVDKHPNAPDVLALYADAMMLQHPWDLWHVNGTPKEWTPAIREVLEKLLKISPDHPGANHYYIHVMEPSPFANLAAASADRLGRLTPGLSHMVHMPSHIYLRTGNYQKGVQVNVEAVNQYNKYKKLFPAVTNNEFLYRLHNEHMLVNNAMMQGKRKMSMMRFNVQ